MDWDRFMAEGEELERRLRDVVLDWNRRKAGAPPDHLPRPGRSPGGHSLVREQPPTGDTGSLDDRLDRFERALAQARQAMSLVQGDVGQMQRDVGQMQRDVGQVQRDVGQVQRDIVEIRERMATRVELEALGDRIAIVADGFAQTQARLAEVAGLLKRHLTAG